MDCLKLAFIFSELFLSKLMRLKSPAYIETQILSRLAIQLNVAVRKHSFAITGINYILKYIKIENGYY